MEEADVDGPALLAVALQLAATAHRDQVDQAGLPYLAHPMRVAARVVGEGDLAVAAGLLHDVVEDSALTLDDLRDAGVPAVVCVAVDALTKREGESHEDAVRRAAADPIAAKVKAADIADNSDPSRLALLDPAVAERLTSKYELALDVLRQQGA